jgi:hypothetical protein
MEQARVILLSVTGRFRGGILSDGHKRVSGAVPTALWSNKRIDAKGMRA